MSRGGGGERMEGGRARSKGPFRLQCGWGVAFSWELREASVATPQGPGLVITGGRDQSTRPRSPSGQETTGSCPNQQILSNNNVNRYVLRLIELFLLGKQLLFSRDGVFLQESSWF